MCQSSEMLNKACFFYVCSMCFFGFIANRECENTKNEELQKEPKTFQTEIQNCCNAEKKKSRCDCASRGGPANHAKKKSAPRLPAQALSKQKMTTDNHYKT